MIGCGGFSRRYHVPAILADGAARLAGIFDPYPQEGVRKLAAETGAPPVGRIEDLPSPPGRTMAIVTTPHTLHAGHVAAALARGWHVLCDKPFVMQLAEARALAADAARRGLVGAVAFNRRLDRGCLRAREIVASGGIGAVRFVETVQLGYERGGWFLDPALGGGGPFTGRATHMADLLPWLLDAKPKELRARLRGGDPSRADDGGAIDLVFDGFEARMTCVTEGWHSWDEVRIFGEEGLIELRRPLKYAIGWEMRWHSRRYEACEYLEAAPNFGEATRDFLGALRNGGKPACTFEDAMISVAIIEEAFASGRGDGGWRSVPAA
jgi:predicted dehydrogenase